MRMQKAIGVRFTIFFCVNIYCLLYFCVPVLLTFCRDFAQFFSTHNSNYDNVSESESFVFDSKQLILAYVCVHVNIEAKECIVYREKE